jgi:hypothetical protein
LPHDVSTARTLNRSTAPVAVEHAVEEAKSGHADLRAVRADA